MITPLSIGRSFSVGRATAAGSTAFIKGIPPYPGPAGGPPIMYGLVGTRPNWNGPAGCFTHITDLIYTSGATLHQLAIMRPLNWTTVSSAAAINQAVINITADPGVYSTNYKYPQPSGFSTGTAVVADNAIAANDYCAYQLVDGTWVFDTVASVATLAITMTTNVPNITGGGVAAGAPFFFFGIVSDSNPQTGVAHHQWDSIASTGNEKFQTAGGTSWCSSLNKGDPLIFYSPNGTNAGKLTTISGYYSPN